ncbi:MAG TPA: hypothetical protein VL326_05690 [Kofleriaceae bacterium]|nr:hypothetical protein [Kofleriaceae bacterium]
MRLRTLIIAVLALTGCPGGGGLIGDHCSAQNECASELQCFSGTCTERCVRAPECGDGYECNAAGLCIAATGQEGDSCDSEVQCSAGLACQIEAAATSDTGKLVASCVPENAGRPAAAACSKDGECRNGTCELGHCIDLCQETRDCGAGTSCTQLPRLPASGHMFSGCLQSTGALSWTIPITGPASDVPLPIPASARSLSVLFTVEDQNQKVGATEIFAPGGVPLMSSGVPFGYYDNPYVRHRPEFGQSVLAIPSTPLHDLQAGLYRLTVRSLRPRPDPLDPTHLIDVTGTATPSMTAVIKLGYGRTLDLHFYFLNLDDHPCGDRFANKLDATTAQDATFFSSYLEELSRIFAPAFKIETVTYEDLRDHPDLDGLDVSNASALLSLGKHSTGINVFFVRTLSPVGLQAIGPNPGPAGLAGTRQSGVIIGVDTLCYRSWNDLARLTAHELARYMGLYRNVEEDPLFPDEDHLHRDPIIDSDDSPSNLMFYSELGGTDLSFGQADILSRSAVLR